MENINITKKYIAISQGLLVAAVLFVASPALAASATGYSDIEAGYGSYSDIEAGYGSYSDIEAGYGSYSDIEAGYGNYPVINMGGGSPNNSTPYSSPAPSRATVSSGSFSGGYSGLASYSYGFVPNLSVMSGGFSGGGSALVSGNYPLASTAGITSGGFSGGNVVSNVPNNNFVPVVSYPYNQVLALNNTPNLSSVYLSDVPYTGAGDTIRIILFTLLLTFWSMILAYMIMKKNQEQNQENLFLEQYV